MKNRKSFPIFDVGLVWAKGVNIWGQVGTIAGVVNTLMMIGVFYTTTVHPNWQIPLWIYLFIIVIGASLIIAFIVKWGISGYYRYFSNQSELSEVHKKLRKSLRQQEAIMKHFNIPMPKDDDKKEHVID